MYKLQTLYGTAQMYDWVIVADTNNPKYHYLIGKIVKMYDSEPAAQIDFTAYDYSSRRAEAAAKQVSSGEETPSKELLAEAGKRLFHSNSLISLSFLCNNMPAIKMFGDSIEGCKVFCRIWSGNYKVETILQKQERLISLANEEILNAIKSEPGVETILQKQERLISLANEEILNAIKSEPGVDVQQSIEFANRLADMVYIQKALIEQPFSEKTLDYLLKFEKPLRVIAIAWNTIRDDSPSIPDIERISNVLLRNRGYWLEKFAFADSADNEPTQVPSTQVSTASTSNQIEEIAKKYGPARESTQAAFFYWHEAEILVNNILTELFGRDIQAHIYRDDDKERCREYYLSTGLSPLNPEEVEKLLILLSLTVNKAKVTTNKDYLCTFLGQNVVDEILFLMLPFKTLERTLATEDGIWCFEK